MDEKASRLGVVQKESVQVWPTYDPASIEPKWQRYWEESQLYRAVQSQDKPKYYCLDFFPYPSGEGLHVGHCRNYVPTDVISRFKRMNGFNVLHPMGWDAFAEPTEQFAIAHGIHPRLTTDRNTANFRRQMTMIGASYDWSREIDSSKPEFYRWTQWFFLLLYRRGLAYRDTNWQWWCPVCQTTLSRNEVSGGVCWRGHSGVTRREIPAWYFKITAYADELLDGLEHIDWPDPIKRMQRNWIGRSEGCQIVFQTEANRSIPVFTTRPDTVCGATFLALAPEHELVTEVTAPQHRSEVEAYVTETIARGEVDRMAEARAKTGVFTGGYAVNPINGERLPIWVADFVLPSYGTGAIMGVPAHDARDFDFARKYGLEIRPVVVPEGAQARPPEQAYTGKGRLVNSGPFDGLDSDEAFERIAAYLQKRNLGQKARQYRMHDWLISRQRYWGAPIPIVYCDTCGEMPVPEDQLPVLLPPMEDFAPDGTGRSPLARAPGFVKTECPNCGEPARRETDTMGGFACSSWYFLRFTSPHYDRAPFEERAMRYWMPVDLYVGGAEHAVLHLLYARFWTSVMADAGLVPFREPFSKLLNQGQLLAPDGQRMSKSRGNVITPDSVVASYGADALRIYELFMAPFDQDVSWNTDGINGASRFLNRVWELFSDCYHQGQDARGSDAQLEREMHRLVSQVTSRMRAFRFNTVISALMEFTNFLNDRQRDGQWRTKSFHQSLQTLIVLLAPVAPHMAEEIWHLMGQQDSVHQQDWPAWDPELTQEDYIEIPIQVDGKVRAVLSVPVDSEQAEIRRIALEEEGVRRHIGGRRIFQVFYVPGKIMNILTDSGE
jgi:leucyl-tRNA synthetase